MILANFKSWKSLSIVITLVIISVIFSLLPPTQQSINRDLFHAVAENNITKAKDAIEKGAQTNFLLSSQLPLVSLAIEYENEAMVALLLDDKIDLDKVYGKGYMILQHGIEKENKKIITMLVDHYERNKHGK